jgi:peptide/nickel transport system substrate-binding protein
MIPTYRFPAAGGRAGGRRLRASAAATLALLAALVGCGGAGSPAEEPGAATNTLSGGPAGGVLVVLADREPDQLNPLTFSSAPAYHAVHLMFRPLARRDSTLSGYQPDLVRTWRFAGDSTLVLELRDDVFWHDGVKVSADDVIFTIERQREAATASPRRADVAAVRRASAVDSFTVAVELDRTSVYTINALLEVVPVPRHLLHDVEPAELRNAPFGREPVGNGFYRFRGWTAGQSLVLDVNPDRPEGRAAIDRIVMRFIPDIAAGMTELMAGQGDLLARLPPDQRDRIAASPNVAVHSAPRVRPAWLALNTRRAPFDDARVRRAVAMSIDRATISRWLFGEDGEPALSPIPAVLREHSPDVRPLPFDSAGAGRLLAEAGWTARSGDGILVRDGRRLRIEVEYISTDQTRRDVLVAMQTMLRRVGIDLVPRAYESTAWVQRLREGSFVASFWGWGWGPGVVGPNAEMVFHSRSIPPNGANFAASNHPRIDALIDRVLVATDTTALRPLWAELEQLMIDDAVYVPIYMDPELFGVHARFRNVRFRGIEWVEDAPYWYVDASGRLARDRVR